MMVGTNPAFLSLYINGVINIVPYRDYINFSERKITVSGQLPFHYRTSFTDKRYLLITMVLAGKLMKQVTSIWLYDYWNKIRNDRVAPKRVDINPSQIGPILPKTFIIEYREDHQYYYRIAGSAVCDYYGKELQGHCLTDQWQNIEDRYTVTNMFDSVRNRLCAGIIHFEVISHYDQKAQIEMLLLPILNDCGQVERILGCISSNDYKPWLGQLPIAKQRLLSTNLIWPQTNTEKDFSTAAVLRANQGRVVCVKKRYFRVIEGGKQG